MSDGGFQGWLDTFLSEKEIDLDHLMMVEGPVYGTNAMPVACLVDAIKSTSAEEQAQIKAILVRLDFANQPILPFLEHIAQAITL